MNECQSCLLVGACLLLLILIYFYAFHKRIICENRPGIHALVFNFQHRKEHFYREHLCAWGYGKSGKENSWAGFSLVSDRFMEDYHAYDYENVVKTFEMIKDGVYSKHQNHT